MITNQAENSPESARLRKCPWMAQKTPQAYVMCQATGLETPSVQTNSLYQGEWYRR